MENSFALTLCKHTNRNYDTEAGTSKDNSTGNQRLKTNCLPLIWKLKWKAKVLILGPVPKALVGNRFGSSFELNKMIHL